MTTWHEHLLSTCRTDAERESVLRDVLNQSRIAAGFDYVVRPVAPEVAPRTFKESKRQVILAALTKHNGNKSHAAAELGISRSTIHEYIRAKPVKNVIRLAQVAAVLLMLVGCSGRQSPGRYKPQDEPWMPVAAAAPIAPELPTQNAQQQRSTMAEPRGLSVALAWDAVTWESFTIYASTNKTDWRVIATTTNTTAVVTNIFLPQAFRVTSRLGDDESDPSNVVTVIGQDTHIAVYAESAPDASGTNWTQYATVFRGTNVSEAMKLFRTRADNWKTFKVE